MAAAGGSTILFLSCESSNHSNRQHSADQGDKNPVRFVVIFCKPGFPAAGSSFGDGGYLDRLMPNQPAAKLPGHNRFTGDRDLLGPTAVDPHSEPARVCKRKVHQFYFKCRTGFMILNDHDIVSFGSRHVPVYRDKLVLASQISKMIVHYKILARAYRARSTSR